VSTNGRNKLPKDMKKNHEHAPKETKAFLYHKGAKMDEELLQKMKAAGIQVNEADKDAFIKASKPVYDEFSKEVPDARQVIDSCIKLGK
jgi:TRAP-type C4-dicarboxylate transport system substrate-binding protein